MRNPTTLITEAHDLVRSRYAPAIGRSRDELTTPALLLDLPTLRANLEFMAHGMRGVSTTLRAHVKVHKSPHIARMEVEHGAIGVGCATVWEAIVMARAGIDDVFVINEVVGHEKTRALALLAREAHVKAAVDDAAQIDELSRAAVAAASTIGVLIDVDEGMHRCGVASAEEALPLARRIAEAPGLEFVGLTGYEGHCSLEFDETKRHAMAGQAMSVLSRRPDRIVLDAGSKTVGASAGKLKDPDLEMYRFDEEHSIFLADASCPLRIGDTVEILCNYTPFAIGYFEAYHVMEDGHVVDIWPVMPRGPESRWLLDLLERGES
jgi:D-serine deaminase-like pyridoxal phosphate-dependent protein